MGARTELSSSEWVSRVRIPEITTDSEWFLWNVCKHTKVNSVSYGRPWSILFLPQCLFPCVNFTKTPEITLKSSEITVRGRKSHLSLEEIYLSSSRSTSTYHRKSLTWLQNMNTRQWRSSNMSVEDKTNNRSTIIYQMRKIDIPIRLIWSRSYIVGLHSTFKSTFIDDPLVW